MGSTLGTIRGTIQIDYDGKGVVKAEKDLEDLGKTSQRTQGNMNNAATGMAVAGGVIAAGFAVAVKSAATFEAKLSDIKAVSGATTADMELIRQKALQLGKDTSFSASEAADAMTELAKAGLSIPEIMNGAADATVALAAAGGVALPEAAAIASNAMNQFGLKAQDMPRIADLIAGAANSSAIDVSDFGFSIAQAGAVANLAGLSFEDTAAAIALMGNAGIKGSDAGTSLKTMLQNLIPTTKQQIELSKELGLITKDGSNAFFDAQGKVKGLADISQTLQTALKGMTKEQQLATLETLFGSDAIRGAAILAQNGASGFNEMAASMSKVKAADVAATKLDNLNGKLEAMKGSLETAGIQLGTILIPALTKLVTWVTALIGKFAGLSPQTQQIILYTLGAVAAFLLLGGAVIKTVQFIQGMQAAIATIKAFTIWSKIARAATVAWTAVQWALNLAMSLNPVGIIIIAIIALVAIIVILWMKSAAFRNFFIGIWNHIWTFMKIIGAWFAGPFADFFVSLWKRIVSIFNAIWSVIKTVIDFVVAGFMFWWKIVSSVIGFFAPLFKATFGLIVSIIQLAWSIITAVIQVAITIIWAVISTVFNALVAYWKFVWGLVWGVIQFIWGLIGPFVMAAIGFIQSIISTVLNWLIGFWTTTWNNVWTALKIVWAFIVAYFTIAWNLIKNIFTTAVNNVTTFLTGAWNFIWGIIKGAWDGISAFFTGLWDFIVGVFRRAIENITRVIDGVKNFVNKIKEFFNQLKEAASGGVGSLIDFVKQIPNRIISALGNLGSALWSKGRDLIQGFINGIRAMGGTVRDALVGLLPGPLKGFANMLGLASPSKLFRKWGVFTVQGFVNGLASMENRLRAAVTGFAGMAVNPAMAGVAGGSPATSGAFAAAPATNNVTATSGPVHVTLNVDGKQLGEAAVLNPEKVATQNAVGSQTRTWAGAGR